MLPPQNLFNSQGKIMMNSENSFYNAVKAVAVILAALSITACVTEMTDRSPGMRFSETAVISVQDPNLSITQKSTFSWLPEAIKFYGDARLDSESLKTMITDEIAKNLAAREMQLIDSESEATYSVAFTAALESALDDAAIIKRYGLLPGNSQIPEGDSNIEKGSLIIYVFDNRSNEVIWRSAAQVGVRFDMNEAERKQRVMSVVAEMFQTFPVKKELNKK